MLRACAVALLENGPLTNVHLLALRFIYRLELSVSYCLCAETLPAKALALLTYSTYSARYNRGGDIEIFFSGFVL